MSRFGARSTKVALVVACAAVVLSVAGTAAADPVSLETTPTCTKLVRWDLEHTPSFSIPASSGNSITCLLREGNSGSAVEALQQDINGCYRSPSNYIVVDGIFGPATKRALQAAQRRAGTGDDGVYGRYTRRAFVWGGPAWQGCSHLSPNP